MSDRRDDDQHYRMADVSPMEFGKFVGVVEILVVEVANLRLQVKTLEGQISGGRGIIYGIMLASGGIGAGAAHLLDKLWK